MHFSIIRQIIARAFLWVFLLSTDVVAPMIQWLMPRNVWTYLAGLIITLAIFAATFLLGEDDLACDIREICLYDVFLQCLSVSLYMLGMPTIAISSSLAGAIFFLKYGRLIWLCRTANGKDLAAWPTFGVLGWFAKSHTESAAESATEPTRQQAWLAYGYMALCLVAGFAIQKIGFKFTLAVFCIFPLIAIPACYRRVLHFLQAQFDDHATAIADAAEKRQQAIAAAQESHNLVLAANNQELAATNERLAQTNTELEQAKTALEQANAAKQIALDELAGMNDALRDAAHDLQAPLGVIGLRANRLLHADTPQERQSASSLLQESIQFMGRAIYDTVHEAKIVTGIVRPTITAIEVDDLLVDLLDELDDIAFTYKMADMAIFPSEATGLIVASDIRLLRRILYNLMHNAITHSHPGTTVLLSVRARHGGVLVQVWDNGPGIEGIQSKDGAANFYTLVERLRGNMPSARTTGHGLGLNNVLQLTKALDLTMTVHSRVGRGTVFSVILPLAEPALISANLSREALDAL